MTRKFLIRTFGCQMNEHDSERLAGQLVADGLEATDDLDEADVVVLNTCCIRENADNKLYGHLGHLRSLKAERPELQIAVTGCLSQKDKGALRERADHIDVVVGTHNIMRTPVLLRQAAIDGPITEILDAPDPVEMTDAAPALTAVREVPWAAWVTIQTGCDNSCAYCIVPSVRGQEISRPLLDIVEEARVLASRGVVEITPMVATSPSDVRCSRSFSNRWGRWRASTASGSRARIPRISDRRRSRPWREPMRCATSCTSRCSPVRMRS